MCRSGKIEHASREAARAAQHKLVYDNGVRGRDGLSARLNVYPCRDCGAWHVGHSSEKTPSAYHYDSVNTVFDAMTDTVALRPEKPKRLPKSMRRRHSGPVLALLLGAEERAPLVWFSWNAAWAFAGIPHPGAFGRRPVEQQAAVTPASGLLRIEVPAWVAKLRWSDYIQRNATDRLTRRAMSTLGNPADWLATDEAVPRQVVRSIEIWYRGAWVDAETLDGDAFDAWLATERKDKDDGTQ